MPEILREDDAALETLSSAVVVLEFAIGALHSSPNLALNEADWPVFLFSKRMVGDEGFEPPTHSV